MPDIQKRLKYLVKDSVDFLLYLTVERSTDAFGAPVAVRRLYMQNYPEFSLKVPLDGFPDYIEWEGDVNEGIDKFMAAFDKAVEITRAKKGLGAPAKKTESAPSMVQEEELPWSDDNIDDLKEKAVAKRDAMLETLTKQEVANVLKSILGTVKIAEVNDVDKLKAFLAA
jgi:hypothetical protein